ncbi:SRPBCC family protein [Paenibacillus flagellatus]|uniref:ATPase n=1 Tax=Paenibacillus flagellatus TaxID=2211139 RepID=A0A2V5K4S6_9BACL|nr:SRPBCC family protein [Paenibacillus flagellatus]PYI54335.1 ATPase [Paenibacillus flagellatus]
MAKTSIVAEPNKQEIVISRTFEAPRELVFRMWTDQASIPEWWGPSVMTTVVDSLDVKKGGVWRYVQRDPAGNEYAHNGVFHEVAAPERLVHTYEFEGVPSVGLVTVTFEELDGGRRTKLTETSLYPSVEVRDGVLQSGMTEGAMELMDRFADILDKQK